MSARLLACPLCSQPSFVTLDALRTGLVSAATRPLMCPVCNDVVFGIDKLTIHLFGHTIGPHNDFSHTVKLDGISQYDNDHVTIDTQQALHLQKWNPLISDGSILDKSTSENNIGSTDIPNLNETVNMLSSQVHLYAYERQNKDCENKVSKKDTLNLIEKVSDITLEKYDDFQIDLQTESIKSTSSYNCKDNINTNVNRLKTKEYNGSEIVDDWTEYHSTNTICDDHSDTVQRISDSARPPKDAPKESYVVNNTWKESILTDFLPDHCIPSTCNKTNDYNVESKEPECAKPSAASSGCPKTDSQNKIAAHTLPASKVSKNSVVEEKTVRCNICGFNFPDVNILVLHKQLIHKIHEKEGKGTCEDLKSFPCHLCSKVFKMRGSLMIHLRVAHSACNLGSLPKKGDILLALNENGYNCPICGKNFRKEQHVVQHLKTHNGKQWKCDVCYKMFTTKYFLKKHKRLHSGEMPYKCNICDKTFTFQQSYHKHRLYHKADKPHMCTTCGRSFKELSTLHNHERIHTGEKPFACETCGKCFRQRVSYLVHRRIHTGVMPYNCTLCGKSFRYKVSQRTHKCTMQVAKHVPLQINDQTTLQISNVSVKNHETVCLQECNLSQQNVVDVTAGNSEENKFILIINTQGQHVLRRESDINRTELPNKKQIEGTKVIDTNRICEDLWNSDIFYNCKQSTEMTTEETANDNLCIKNGNDFLSVVMSAVQNETSSPLNKMEHLRLSSPVDKEILIESHNNTLKLVPNNVLLNVNDTHVNTNFSGGTGITNPLQTINEESFKELLYNAEGKK